MNEMSMKHSGKFGVIRPQCVQLRPLRTENSVRFVYISVGEPLGG